MPNSANAALDLTEEVTSREEDVIMQISYDRILIIGGLLCYAIKVLMR